MTGDHGSSTSRRVLHARWRGHVAARLSPVRPLYVHMASSGGDDLCRERLACDAVRRYGAHDTRVFPFMALDH